MFSLSKQPLHLANKPPKPNLKQRVKRSKVNVVILSLRIPIVILHLIQAVAVVILHPAQNHLTIARNRAGVEIKTGDKVV